MMKTATMSNIQIFLNHKPQLLLCISFSLHCFLLLLRQKLKYLHWLPDTSNVSPSCACIHSVLPTFPQLCWVCLELLVVFSFQACSIYSVLFSLPVSSLRFSEIALSSLSHIIPDYCSPRPLPSQCWRRFAYLSALISVEIILYLSQWQTPEMILSRTLLVRHNYCFPFILGVGKCQCQRPDWEHCSVWLL